MDTRDHIHALETLLRSLIDPVAQAAAQAPADDEPVSEEDRRRFQEGQAWIANGGQATPMEEVMAEFGLKPEDL